MLSWPSAFHDHEWRFEDDTTATDRHPSCERRGLLVPALSRSRRATDHAARVNGAPVKFLHACSTVLSMTCSGRTASWHVSRTSERAGCAELSGATANVSSNRITRTLPRATDGNL